MIRNTCFCELNLILFRKYKSYSMEYLREYEKVIVMRIRNTSIHRNIWNAFRKYRPSIRSS